MPDCRLEALEAITALDCANCFAAAGYVHGN